MDVPRQMPRGAANDIGFCLRTIYAARVRFRRRQKHIGKTMTLPMRDWIEYGTEMDCVCVCVCVRRAHWKVNYDQTSVYRRASVAQRRSVGLETESSRVRNSLGHLLFPLGEEINWHG